MTNAQAYTQERPCACTTWPGPKAPVLHGEAACAWQGVTADGGLFLKFAQEGKKGDAPKAESPSLRKLRVSESRKHSLKEHKAAKQLHDLAHQGKTGTTIVEPLSSRPDVPLLAILLMCTGTRGDVQPFIVRLVACAQPTRNRGFNACCLITPTPLQG